MLPLLIPDQPLTSTLEQHLYEFAVEGFRTLVVCQRKIDNIEFRNWYKDWKELNMDSQVNKQELLEQ